MDADYPARYRDEFGEEETTIHNTGSSLRMVLRGVAFSGSMLDDWEPIITDGAEPTLPFSLHRNALHSYGLDFELPVSVVRPAGIVSASLRIHLDLGAPKINGAVDHENLQLELRIDEQAFKSCGEHGWFDDELQELQSVLPEGTLIKSCFNCAFSDYNPAGFGLFGDLACFRNSKQAYLSLTGKAAYFELQDKIAEFVQETYLCSEFEKRVPGTGYRA